MFELKKGEQKIREQIVTSDVFQILSAALCPGCDLLVPKQLFQAELVMSMALAWGMERGAGRLGVAKPRSE